MVFISEGIFTSKPYLFPDFKSTIRKKSTHYWAGISSNFWRRLCMTHDESRHCRPYLPGNPEPRTLSMRNNHFPVSESDKIKKIHTLPYFIGCNKIRYQASLMISQFNAVTNRRSESVFLTISSMSIFFSFSFTVASTAAVAGIFGTARHARSPG